jgi:hypothetical protein
LLSSSACRVRPILRSTDESTTPWRVIEAITAWFSKLFSHRFRIVKTTHCMITVRFVKEQHNCNGIPHICCHF